VNSLELNNVHASIKGKLVLEDINLSLTENEFLGVIGPNGAGKTTLLKVLVGLIKPDSGTVLVAGKSIEKSKREVGYVPQFNTFDNQYPISVYEVVRMGLLSGLGLLKFGDKKHSEKITKALTQVGLQDFLERNINELSGGEIQRVLIARALVNSPKLLLLDEPTASVDSFHGQNFYELLNELNKSITIVLVSHDIGAVSSYVKKIACLNKTLVFHDSKSISKEMLEKTYKCPIDLIAHGVPHRVLDHHEH